MLYEQRFRLDGKVALVTGGGRGIGEATCVALAEAGAVVGVQDIDDSAAERVARRVAANGGRAIALVGDIADHAVIERVMGQTVNELGRLDVLVNNAGIYPFANFLDLPLETLDRVLNLNLRAVFLCTQSAGRLMAKLGNGGSIISLASVQGLRPTSAGVSHYDTTKAGVIMLTKAAALELAPHSIRVNAVAPGLTETPGTEAVIAAGGNAAQRVPLGRLGRVEDVAYLIAFLASPAAEYITGETVVVDGGYLLT